MLNNLKSILKSRTLWFSVILAVLSILQGSIGLLDLTHVQQAYVGAGIAAIVAALRAITSQPVLQK